MYNEVLKEAAANTMLGVRRENITTRGWQYYTHSTPKGKRRLELGGVSDAKGKWVAVAILFIFFVIVDVIVFIVNVNVGVTFALRRWATYEV